MTICFTLPYSSGGCEERRIKFDLLTAIIKCSLLASIKARRLMLTWLNLMQPWHAAALPFSSATSFCHTSRVSVCVWIFLPTKLCIACGSLSVTYLLMGRKWLKWFPFLAVSMRGRRSTGKFWNLLSSLVSPHQQIYIVIDTIMWQTKTIEALIIISLFLTYYASTYSHKNEHNRHSSQLASK